MGTLGGPFTSARYDTKDQQQNQTSLITIPAIIGADINVSAAQF